MKPVSNPLRRLTTCTLAALTLAGLAATAPAHAENHALIMWIGDYGNPRADLPGIDLDAANARKIALAMGVPQANITEISNAQLTGENMAKGMVGLLKRINDGDKVFLYYSGHGAQVPGHETNAKCTEALVARDGLVLDADMQTVLTALGQKASQVVMMNDSCFSGGAATKTLAAPPPGAKPKFLPPDVKTNSSVTSGYACGDATNSTKMARSLSTMAKDSRGPQVLYIAASNDTQVSFATREGSIGTLAWAACMQAAAADTDRSGRINGEELQLCAQNFIDRRRTKQTITLQGNAQLPLSFVKGNENAAPAPAAAQATAAAPAPAPAPAAASASVNAARALHDLQAAADRALQVQMSTARNSLRVGVDFLDFSVSTAKDGYLYLLQVGSDGQTFNLLFPNKLDDNNFLTAGTHRFPRQSWRVRAGGPAGASHILAIVSPVKKDLSRGMDVSSVFPHNTANNSNTRTLVVEASGADAGGSGRYGASAVVTINETAPLMRALAKPTRPIKPMLRRVALAASLSLALAAGGLPAAAGTAAAAGPAATAPADAPVAALGDLGLALLRQAAPGNAVVSPVATASALGMVHAGTAGAAEHEIEALFGPQRTGSRALKTRLPALFRQLGAGPTAMAGRMWIDTGAAAAVPTGYTQRLATRWGADATRLAFNEPEAARKQINTWTAERTAGRITELLPAGSITSATQLALTTAVHFRSPWEKPFDASRTEDRAFAGAPGKSQNVPTMVDERSVAQVRVDGALVIELPFAAPAAPATAGAASAAAGAQGASPAAYALLLAVPAEGRSVDQLLQGLNGGELARWRSALQPQRCVLALPKFDIKPQSGSLKSALQAMGVKTVFTEQADLRPMLGRKARTMHLDDVHHAAGITIDEQGGEAVAATAATVRAKSISLPAPPCAVDRAFVFAVVHRATGTPLFVGRVTDPMPTP